MEQIRNRKSSGSLELGSDTTVYELVLNYDGSPSTEGSCVSAPQGHILRIILPAGSRLCMKNPIAHTNYPANSETLFEREKFVALKRYVIFHFRF